MPSPHLAPLPGGVSKLRWQRAAGSIVWSDSGQELVDFTSGVLIANLGHSHPAVTAAIVRQAGELVATFVGHHDSRDRYAEKLVTAISSAQKSSATSSARLDMVAYASSGAEAVDLAVRVARAATGRSTVLAFIGSYHGKSTETVGLGGMAGLRKGLRGLAGSNVIHAPYPDSRKIDQDGLFTHLGLGRELAESVAPDDVAAVLAEPYLGAGGAIVPPPGFLDGCRLLADRLGARLIVDEVQSGFGRTGPLFSFSEMDSGPDMAVLAKGIANGVPMAAVVGTTSDMMSPGPGTLWSSYSGNPLACAAAEATLEVLQTEVDPARTVALGHRISQAVNSWMAGDVKDIRGAGMSLGFDVVNSDGGPDPDRAAEIVDLAVDNGVVLLPPAGPQSNVVRIAPPLTITDEELDRGLESLRLTIAGDG